MKAYRLQPFAILLLCHVKFWTLVKNRPRDPDISEYLDQGFRYIDMSGPPHETNSSELDEKFEPSTGMGLC